MRKNLLTRKRRDLVSGFLLAMLLFRAYVPVGFMPASGAPFLVELCPAAAPMSMAMPAHHHHADSHSHFEHCPFGSATAAGPALVFGAVNPLPAAATQSTVFITPIPPGVQRVQLPQPRGPPTLV
jgi:hypothetical protein